MHTHAHRHTHTHTDTRTQTQASMHIQLKHTLPMICLVLDHTHTRKDTSILAYLFSSDCHGNVIFAPGPLQKTSFCAEIISFLSSNVYSCCFYIESAAHECEE